VVAVLGAEEREAADALARAVHEAEVAGVEHLPPLGVPALEVEGQVIEAREGDAEEDRHLGALQRRGADHAVAVGRRHLDRVAVAPLARHALGRS
jgi:hypothetical protein